MSVHTEEIRKLVQLLYDKALKKHNYWMMECHRYETILVMLDEIERDGKK